jgi:hypothetical protein
MMHIWTEYQNRITRERRAEQLARAGRRCLTIAAAILALTIAANIVRAAAITGANLPHTLEQAARF